MEKISLEEFMKLPPVTRMMWASATKSALKMEQMGFSREKYIEWCLGIWESMKMLSPEEMDNILETIMRRNFEDAINELNMENN